MLKGSKKKNDCNAINVPKNFECYVPDGYVKTVMWE